MKELLKLLRENSKTNEIRPYSSNIKMAVSDCIMFRSVQPQIQVLAARMKIK